MTANSGVMTLLDAAIGELDREEHPAKARKVREYVDAHFADPIRVAELYALIRRSEAHFSRTIAVHLRTEEHADPEAPGRHLSGERLILEPL